MNKYSLACLQLEFNKSNNDRSKPIYFRITINRKITYINTGVSSEPKHFADGKILNSNGSHQRLNNLIAKQKTLIIDKLYELEMSGREFCIKNFKLMYEKNNLDTDFYSICVNILENIKPKISESHYKTTKYILGILNKLYPNLTFDDINESFLVQLEQHILKEKRTQNTANAYYRTIKLFINYALTSELIDEYFNDGSKKKRLSVFRKVKQKIVEVKIDYLVLDELDKLEDLFDKKILPVHLQNLLHNFLVSCFTGVRKNDLKNLTKKNLVNNEWLDLKTQKNQKQLILPLNDRAKKYFNYSEYENGKILPNLIAKSSIITKYLKTILEKCGIDKKITFHCSRHTFAVNSIIMGIDMRYLQAFLGHASIKTTERYAKAVDKVKFDQMNLWNKKS